ncbi:hypothetical protein, partial [Corynebacterium variabile]|uniref:hypothetical protein n=1 Tax=Corynebacterium variabile TaxID=1727 RepID=UPI001E000334
VQAVEEFPGDHVESPVDEFLELFVGDLDHGEPPGCSCQVVWLLGSSVVVAGTARRSEDAAIP